jgi:drug/metabolite transporter (DMT)-like permease
MRVALGIVATVYFAVAGLLLIWGAWLLATDDPDGGRHPVGAVMLVVAAVCGVLGLVSIRRSRRP